MLWTDIYEIVDELIEKHSETDPEKILFVDLRRMVIDLDCFTDDPDRSNEKILEAIEQFKKTLSFLDKKINSMNEKIKIYLEEATKSYKLKKDFRNSHKYASITDIPWEKDFFDHAICDSAWDSMSFSVAKKGIKEILLIAQDLSYYGVDIYKKRKLYDLLVELSKVDGIEWIRLHYVYPTGFPSNVIELIDKNEKICSYIDMPLQHINDKILKSMRRSTTRSANTPSARCR